LAMSVESASAPARMPTSKRSSTRSTARPVHSKSIRTSG
jgi:hypothetical protein